MMQPAAQRPVRPGLQWVVALTFALWAWAISVPNGYFGWTVFALLWSAPVGAMWLASLVYWVWREPRAVRAAWRSWALAPLLVLLLVLGEPLRLRFAASLPALNAAADEAWAASEQGSREWFAREQRRIGLYGNCGLRVDPHARSVVVEVHDTGWLNFGGFAYVHADDTPHDTPDRYRRLWGRWHQVSLDF